MPDEPAKYPPLNGRHKVIFGVAAVLALASCAGIAAGRMALINWWLVHCDQVSQQCDLARLGFEWWWTLLIAITCAIAIGAHWLTRDRLEHPLAESRQSGAG